jgi:exosome complex RNA-binding protein Rrp4
MLDADEWEEIPVRKIGSNGYVYVRRKYHEEYEARIYLRKKENFDDTK